MRFFALLVALLVMLIGIVGVVAPDRLITVGRFVLTPFGLYAIAAFRIGMGFVLILVAPTSRAPKALRAIGTVVLVAGRDATLRSRACTRRRRLGGGPGPRVSPRDRGDTRRPRQLHRVCRGCRSPGLPERHSSWCSPNVFATGFDADGSGAASASGCGPTSRRAAVTAWTRGRLSSIQSRRFASRISPTIWRANRVSAA